MEIKQRFEGILKKYMNMRFALIILIIGVIFLCLPSGAKTKQAKEEKENFTTGEYVKDLEKRLASILSTISGVSDVSVMITISDGGINIFEHDKNIKKEESQTSLVLKKQGSGVDEPVLIKASTPSVLGVVVTAKGAENSKKNAEIMSAVKAVLDVSAHRISVLSK